MIDKNTLLNRVIVHVNIVQIWIISLRFVQTIAVHHVDVLRWKHINENISISQIDWRLLNLDIASVRS